MFLCFLSERNFFRNIRKKNLRKNSGNINLQYAQSLKSQSERILSYNHLLTEWYYYIFLVFYSDFLFFWKLFQNFFKIYFLHNYHQWSEWHIWIKSNQSTWKRYIKRYVLCRYTSKNVSCFFSIGNSVIWKTARTEI